MAESTKLSGAASEAYIWSSWLLASIGVLSLAILRERLLFAIEESEDGAAKDWAQHLAQKVRLEEEEEEEEEGKQSGEEGSVFNVTVEPILDNGLPPTLQLIIDVPKHGKWDFHQYDVDPYPSVPHGHEQNGHGKLDAYLGFTYVRGKQTGQVPRASIVSLWNNDKFRDFAYRAISWYMVEFPLHRWPVPNPQRLPRRR